MIVPTGMKSGLRGISKFSHFLLLIGGEMPRKEEILCYLWSIHHLSQPGIKGAISLAPAMLDLEGDLRHSLCFSFVDGETKVQRAERTHSRGYHHFSGQSGVHKAQGCGVHITRELVKYRLWSSTSGSTFSPTPTPLTDNVILSLHFPTL